MITNPVLKISEVWKNFGGLVALGGVSLEISQGEILGVIGPNGAGKTTLFNVIAGVFRVDKGEVFFRGKDISNLRSYERCHLGIARTFQITKVFGNLTVLDNLLVAACYGKPGVAKSVYLSNHREKVLGTLDFLGLKSKKDILANKLNISDRKRLEICRALVTEPTLLLLDEVVGGLNPSEVGEIMELIKEINAAGTTILMIEHVMRAVMGVSKRIVVLNFGKKLAEGKPEEIQKNPSVIEAYLGGSTHAAS
jgi:branched-chain amino acid transport system ATP-binding protein